MGVVCVTNNNYGRRSQLLTWTSCGDVSITFQNFIVTYYQRQQNVYPHVTHTKYRPLSEHLRKAMFATESSYARRQRGYLNECSLCCNLMILKTGGQERPVS